MSESTYYADSTQFGNYQYVTLDALINDYMMSRDSDDYTSTIPRYKVLYQAKRGLRELYYDILREVRAIELDLSPTLNVILPPDFVNYVRISWVGEDGQLHPMAMDNRMSIAQVYLQDSNYNILFDSQGCPLKDNSSHQASTNDSDESTDPANLSYSVCYDGFVPNKDNSSVFSNGKFTLKQSEGLIQFGSDAQGKSIVLEYISDGLYTSECEGGDESNIKVHKFAESTLLDYMYYQLIKNRRNVSANEKQRARKEYYNSRRITKRRINSLRVSDIMQVFKGDSKWIK